MGQILIDAYDLILSYLALINGHVNAIKACVRPWKNFDILVPVNSKLSDIPVVALKERIGKEGGKKVKNLLSQFPH